MRHASRAWVGLVAFAAFAIALGCKPKMQSMSQMKAIVDQGNSTAFGFLPVRRYLPQALSAKDEELSEGQRWAKDQMVNGIYYAFIQCTDLSGIKANVWYRDVEKYATMNVLYVDAAGELTYHLKKEEAPDATPPCRIVNDRLITYSLIHTLLEEAYDSGNVTEGSYRLMQALYLSLRGAYGKDETTVARTKLLLLPLAKMMQQQAGLAAVDAEKYVADQLAKDPDFVPDACGVSGHGKLGSQVSAWKNANFGCVDGGDAKGAKNFLPGSAFGYDKIRDLTGHEIDAFFAKTPPKGKREELIEILTNVKQPVPQGLLKRDYGKSYDEDDDADGADGDKAALRLQAGPTVPKLRPYRPGKRPGRPFPPSSLVVPSTRPGTMPSGRIPTAGPGSQDYLRSNAGLLLQPQFGGEYLDAQEKDFVRNMQQHPEQFQPMQMPQGSAFTGYVGPGGQQVIFNNATREPFFPQTMSFKDETGAQQSGTLWRNSPHMGNDPNMPGFVGLINGIGGNEKDSSLHVVTTSGRVEDMHIRRTGNDKDGYLYDCQDIKRAQSEIDQMKKEGTISSDQYATANKALAWARKHSNCAAKSNRRARPLRLRGAAGFQLEGEEEAAAAEEGEADCPDEYGDDEDDKDKTKVDKDEDAGETATETETSTETETATESETETSTESETATATETDDKTKTDAGETEALTAEERLTQADAEFDGNLTAKTDAKKDVDEFVGPPAPEETPTTLPETQPEETPTTLPVSQPEEQPEAP